MIFKILNKKINRAGSFFLWNYSGRVDKFSITVFSFEFLLGHFSMMNEFFQMLRVGNIHVQVILPLFNFRELFCCHLVLSDIFPCESFVIEVPCCYFWLFHSLLIFDFTKYFHGIIIVFLIKCSWEKVHLSIHFFFADF